VVIGLETFQEISRKFFGNCVSGNRARNCVRGYVEPCTSLVERCEFFLLLFCGARNACMFPLTI
jgi:hypothetical protein